MAMATLLQGKRFAFACFQTSKQVSRVFIDSEYRLITPGTLEHPALRWDIAMEEQWNTSNRDVSSGQEEVNINYSPETLFYRFIVATPFRAAARAYG